jgi:drug/metabolite transporter (DMT)-like permease
MSQTGESMTRKGWLLFTMMSVIWGTPYLFIKIAVRELDPIMIVFARVGIATAVLLPVATRLGVLRQLHGRLLTVAALACVQIAGPFLLISYGELYITSSLTSLLIAADPLLVVLFALRFDPSERVTGLRLIGLLIGLGGVVVLLGLDVGGDEHRLLGAILVLLGAAGYAAGALLIKRPTIASLPSLGVVTIECATTTVILLPLAVTRFPGKVPNPELIGSLLALGLICTALAYLLFFALVAQVGASRSTVITYVNPAVSVLLGITFLGEPLNTPIIVGFLLIIVGSWLSTSGALPPLSHIFGTRRQQQTRTATKTSKQDTCYEHL